ncbi:MAG: nucleotidyltransferase domain-containing protein [Bdellovibrionales bacterium]|nr:nucleotidyltransferase domain-containing protein [Bdellovibrionales bacterium]
MSEIRNILASVLDTKKRKSVSVFGSRATGKHRQYSDLDLWIESDPELTSRELQDLRERLEESDLPITVDVVTPATCLDAYRENILKTKMAWF